MSWRDQAACAGKPTEWWFPARNDGPDVDRARSVCASCPVRDECEDAGRGEYAGMWGGHLIGDKERKAKRIQSRASKRGNNQWSGSVPASLRREVEG